MHTWKWFSIQVGLFLLPARVVLFQMEVVVGNEVSLVVAPGLWNTLLVAPSSLMFQRKAKTGAFPPLPSLSLGFFLNHHFQEENKINTIFHLPTKKMGNCNSMMDTIHREHLKLLFT